MFQVCVHLNLSIKAMLIPKCDGDKSVLRVHVMQSNVYSVAIVGYVGRVHGILYVMMKCEHNSILK